MTQVIVSSGQTAHNAAAAGDSVLVKSGGLLTGATATSGGLFAIENGGSSYNTLLASGGAEVVSAGGRATKVELVRGGSVIYARGGYVSGVTQIGSCFVVASSGSTVVDISDTGGAIQAFTGGVVSNATVNSGIAVAYNGGKIYQLSLINSGSGSAAAGGLIEGTTISNGGVLYVSGVASNTVVNTNGKMQVASGGVARGNTLKGGTVTVSHGGVAAGNIVSSGGGLGVAGTASNTTVNNGGVVEVTSGGTAQSNTLNSGGELYADAHSVLGTTTVSSGAHVTVSSGASISGLVTLQDGGAATIWNNAGGTINLQGDTNTGLVVSGLTSGGTLTTVISGFNGTSSSKSDSIELVGLKAADVSSVTYPNANQVELTLNSGNSITLNIVGVSQYGFNLSDGADGWLDYEVCFLSGSMIRTVNGDVAAENIELGDKIITFDWQNNQEIICPVSWVGKAHAKVRPGLPDDEAGYPVRILKDAFAEGLPYKDMLITAEHCMFFDGKFVPVRMLVNGVSIFYDKSITSYDYYHVETEQHAVICADGVLTESYLDTGNRRAFRQQGTVVALHGMTHSWEDDAAAPLCVEREFVEPIFRSLEARCIEVFGALSSVTKKQTTNDPDLHLVTETGALVRPARCDEGKYSFILPPTTSCVRVVSRTSRPIDAIGPFIDDRRNLGVSVGAITLLTTKGTQDIFAQYQTEQPEGWYVDNEGSQVVWTNGNAMLPLGKAPLRNEMRMLSLTIEAAGPYLLTEYENQVVLSA